jgi:hypothetical protein
MLIIEAVKSISFDGFLMALNHFPIGKHKRQYLDGNHRVIIQDDLH